MIGGSGVLSDLGQQYDKHIIVVRFNEYVFFPSSYTEWDFTE